MAQDNTYSLLKRAAIILAVVVLGFLVYEQFFTREPGTTAYLKGNTLFEDRQYASALERYDAAIRENPDLVAAYSARGNTLRMMGRIDDAILAYEEAIARRPNFGGYYALRGMAYDLQGKYDKAIADYETSLKKDPEVADGMHWLTRLLYNVQEKPPTIDKRLNYLKEQMKLPEKDRVLSKPELDGKGKPYEQ